MEYDKKRPFLRFWNDLFLSVFFLAAVVYAAIRFKDLNSCNV